jgi:MFS family permease
VRRSRRGATPLVEPSLFSNRAYVSGVAFTLVFLGAMAGLMLTTGILLQVGLGFSALEASIAMAPWATGAFAGSGFAAVMMHRLGRRILHLGIGLMGVSLLALYGVVRAMGTELSGWDLLVPNLIGGAGMGMIFVPLFDIILGGVADGEVGSASGLLGSVQQLGMALGVAVLGTVLFGFAGGQAERNFDAGAAPGLRAALVQAGVPAGERAPMIAALRTCVVDREGQADPEAVPAACEALRPAGSPAVAAAMRRAESTDARAGLSWTGRAARARHARPDRLAFGLVFALPPKARVPAGARSEPADRRPGPGRLSRRRPSRPRRTPLARGRPPGRPR